MRPDHLGVAPVNLFALILVFGFARLWFGSRTASGQTQSNPN